jgi:hypothetical protein
MIKDMQRWVEIAGRALLLISLAAPSFSAAQESANRASSPAAPDPNLPTDSVTAAIRSLQERVHELQVEVVSMRSEWERNRAETANLRRQLDQMRLPQEAEGPALIETAMKTASLQQSDRATDTVAVEGQQDQGQSKATTSATLEDEYQLLAGKVDDQYQTKVESASKYRMRLSGIVLMNTFSNQGVVDSIDLPTLAYARPTGNSGGSFGATLRQSEIGFETFGPTILGAKTRADLQLDLAGGFVAAPNGVTSGLMRLKTGTMRLDWTNSSLIVGQDSIFFSPNTPTSFASLAIPALSYAGNLWSWVPQIRVEHKVNFGEGSSILLQGGILDPVSGEPPRSPGSTTPRVYRSAGPGESARQPAYGVRIAWTRELFGQPVRVGVGGYYNRQDYGFNRNVDGWAGMTDIDLPLSHRLSIGGKFYRGSALGGLYGGIGRSVLFDGDPTSSSSAVRGINDVGGWAQIKFRPTNKWELNLATGIDNPFAKDLEYFAYAQAYGDPALARNQASFINIIYRPKSDLLFSAEYRQIKTKSLVEGVNNAGQLNLMMGVLF